MAVKNQMIVYSTVGQWWAVRLCRPLLFSITLVVSGCISSNSLEKSIDTSDFNNTLGVEAHAVKVSRFLGLKKIGVASFYSDTGPKMKIDLELISPLWTRSIQNNSMFFSIATESLTFKYQTVQEILNTFLTTISEYITTYNFRIDLVAVPTPYSFSETNYKYFTSVVPLTFLFPADKNQSFNQFAFDSLPSIAHEMFHVRQRLARRGESYANLGDFEEEVLAYFFESCISFSVFSRIPALENDLLPSHFKSLSESESDDNLKKQYISKYVNGNNVHQSHAGSAAIHFFLISGKRAQEQDRVSRIPELCDLVFRENQGSQIFEEILE